MSTGLCRWCLRLELWLLPRMPETNLRKCTQSWSGFRGLLSLIRSQGLIPIRRDHRLQTLLCIGWLSTGLWWLCLRLAWPLELPCPSLRSCSRSWWEPRGLWLLLLFFVWLDLWEYLRLCQRLLLDIRLRFSAGWGAVMLDQPGRLPEKRRGHFSTRFLRRGFCRIAWRSASRLMFRCSIRGGRPTCSRLSLEADLLSDTHHPRRLLSRSCHSCSPDLHLL